MRVRLLILSTIAVFLNESCVTYNCRPDSAPFSIDSQLSAEDIAQIKVLWGREELVCENACAWAVRRYRGMKTGGIQECTLEPALELDSEDTLATGADVSSAEQTDPAETVPIVGRP